MALAFALQVWGTGVKPGDVVAAMDLTRLIADIQDEPRSDCYFMVIFRRDTPRDRVATCVNNLSEKFRAEAFQARNYGTEWPYGANQLWNSTMCEVEGRFNEHQKSPKSGRFPYNGVLTFEADCVPMRRDWISALTQEWNSRVIAAGEWGPEEEDVENGKVVGYPKVELLGHEESDHINGNAIFRTDFTKRHTLRYTTNLAWDTYNGKLLKRVGLDTNLIHQNYRRKTIRREEIPLLTKNGVTPALFHGLQDNVGRDARKFMREILVDGVTV